MTAGPTPPKPGRTYRTHDIAALLCASLGFENATTVVHETMTELGIAEAVLDHATAKRLLEHLSQRPGLVGITGRVALSRLDVAKGSSAVAAAVGGTSDRRPLEIVIALLKPTLGEERASALVRETAAIMDIGGDVDLDQALGLLERIARAGGVTGVAARFAKTRIHLSW